MIWVPKALRQTEERLDDFTSEACFKKTQLKATCDIREEQRTQSGMDGTVMDAELPRTYTTLGRRCYIGEGTTQTQ